MKRTRAQAESVQARAQFVIASIDVRTRPVRTATGAPVLDSLGAHLMEPFACVVHEVDLRPCPVLRELTGARFVPGISCAHRWLIAQVDREYDPRREHIEQRCATCRAKCLRDPETNEMVAFSADVVVPELDGWDGVEEGDDDAVLPRTDPVRFAPRPAA